MSERQSHGLKYEDYLFNLHPNWQKTSYTARWDAFDDNNNPISIKTMKLGKRYIEMGDIFRQSEVDRDYRLFIGIWEYDNNNDKIFIEHREYFIPKIFHIENLNKKDLNFQKTVFDNIDINVERNIEKEKIWIEKRKEYSQIWKETNSKFRIYYKKDHKGQKRIQCGIDLYDIEQYRIK